MAFDWRRQPASTLEAHFNPRMTIADVDGVLAGWAARAEDARQRLDGEYDIRYGAGEKQTLDVFRSQNATGLAPVQVFVHGGYWRALDKREHHHVAEPVVAAGAVHVSLNYDLCPDVTLDQILAEVREGLAFVWENAERFGGRRDAIHLAGHSAGAHLAAMLLGTDGGESGLPADVIKSAALVSGIYEPDVVRHISVNADVHLDQAMARRHDAIAGPPRVATPLLIAVGGLEPQGWMQQSVDYAEAARSAGCPVEFVLAPDTNHFTLVDEMADPDSLLCRAIIRTMGPGSGT